MPIEQSRRITLDTPREERRPTIFVSYSRQDTEIADRLINDLARAERDYWLDTTAIKGGDDWILTIAEGIRNSYAMIVIVTANSLDSRWVRDEILWARRKKKKIIPLLFADVEEMDQYLLLVGDQEIDFLEQDYAKALDWLLKSLPPVPGGERKSTPDQRRLELDYFDRLGLTELIATEKYTTLSGEFEMRPVEMTAEYEHRPFGLLDFDEATPRQRSIGRFTDAIGKILEIRRAVLLGEPGGGKTTTLLKLASHLLEKAQQDPQQAVPLFIRLGRWTIAEQPLADFMAQELGPLGAHLDSLLARKRAALLLDGLNELPTGQREQKYPQVKCLVDQHPGLIAIVSCREHDYTVDLGFDRLTIAPLDPLRIREFAGKYLGEERGKQLFWRLAGGDEVRQVFEKWQQAGASFELFWSAPDIPRENPNVFGATSSHEDQIWHDKVHDRHSLMELARNPYMMLMLTSVFDKNGTLPANRGQLFDIFVANLLKREKIAAEEREPLLRGLAEIAFTMQSRPAIEAADDDNENEPVGALTVLPKSEVEPMLGPRSIYLAASTGILSVGDEIRFTHQLLQEYFAARHLDEEIRGNRFDSRQIWQSDNWWQRTNWEETLVLLTGRLGDECWHIIEWVTRGNPEVAASCITRSGANFSEATRRKFIDNLTPRLTDLSSDPDPLARAAIGRAIGLVGPDRRLGVDTQPLVINKTTAIEIPNLDWVEIPAGSFQYGHVSEGAAKPDKVDLPTFYIARYPITMAQFQTFIDDPEGASDPRWFQGLEADDDDRQIQPQYFKYLNHPRDTVNWYQAVAFCRWLSWRLGGAHDLKKIGEWAVRLPTEYEWEKAARGTDGRLYPYGNEFDSARANTSFDIGKTTAVGIFPNGQSPYGVMDMSGNVWEWCLNEYEKPTGDATRIDLRNSNNRPLRGGSWYFNRDFARAVFRYDSSPSLHNFVIGFRVVSVVRPPS